MEATSQQNEPFGKSAEPFVIDTAEKANWALRKLAAVESERALVVAQTKAILDRLDSEEKSLTDRFGSQLEAFTRGQIADGKRKSVVLHYGTMAFRKVPGRWSVVDAEAAKAAAKQVCPEAVTEITVEKLDTKALTDYVDSTGEIVPGVERVPERESFSIKFKTTPGGTETE